MIHADAHRGVAIGAVGLLPQRLGVKAPPLGPVHRRVVDGRVAGRGPELLVAMLLFTPVEADGLGVGAAGAAAAQGGAKIAARPFRQRRGMQAGGAIGRGGRSRDRRDAQRPHPRRRDQARRAGLDQRSRRRALRAGDGFRRRPLGNEAALQSDADGVLVVRPVLEARQYWPAQGDQDHGVKQQRPAQHGAVSQPGFARLRLGQEQTLQEPDEEVCHRKWRNRVL
jgi:hypothetical protein